MARSSAQWSSSEDWPVRQAVRRCLAEHAREPARRAAQTEKGIADRTRREAIVDPMGLLDLAKTVDPRSFRVESRAH